MISPKFEEQKIIIIMNLPIGIVFPCILSVHPAKYRKKFDTAAISPYASLKDLPQSSVSRLFIKKKTK
jgi:hypothetical protein